jgi:hypothetical protein|tara:strand:+ start:4976 stop:5764 length:789 start_codon:yes stop_codon:yes gene_type:complete
LSKKLIIVTISALLSTLLISYFAFFKEYEPHQPVAFSHKIHSGVNKIPCTYCHAYVAKSSQPGIPSVMECMGCHKYVDGKHDPKDPKRIYKYNDESIDPTNYLYDGRKRISFEKEIKKLTGFWERKESIVWVNYHYVPEHAKFPHKPHIRYGLECKTCHGDVENVDIPKPIVKMQMGWCISCHEEKLGKKFEELEEVHKNISKLSDHDKRIMSHTGRIQSKLLYKDFDRKLGDQHKLNTGKEKLININKEVAWLKDCSTCHY